MSIYISVVYRPSPLLRLREYRMGTCRLHIRLRLWLVSSSTYTRVLIYSTIMMSSYSKVHRWSPLSFQC